VTLTLRPARGGFLRPFGCGEFIRDFLLGKGPHGAIKIKAEIGAPQSTIFKQYKMALMRATALDRATREEEKTARKEGRRIDPDNIERLALRHLAHIPYKSIACRYHSFIIFFSDLQRLGWVEITGMEEPSKFQGRYSPGPPRKYFRLTKAGREASKDAWRNPHRALYGRY
jgi:hypothetical protein